MKRIFIIFTIIILSFTFCSKDKPENPDVQVNEDQTETSEDVPEERQFILAGLKGNPLSGATSYLEESDDWSRHHHMNIVDNNPDTAWADGSDGDGTDEEVWIEIEPGVNQISIINGYARNDNIFKRNNRIKTFKVSLWAGLNPPGMAAEAGSLFESVLLKDLGTINLKDSSDIQKKPLQIDWKTALEKMNTLIESSDAFDRAAYILVFEITEIYKGSHYNDTCLSQISWSLSSEYAGPGGLGRIELTGVWTNESGDPWNRLEIEWSPLLQSWTAYKNEELYDSGKWYLGDGRLILSSDGRESEFIYTDGSYKNKRLILETDKGDEQIWLKN